MEYLSLTQGEYNPKKEDLLLQEQQTKKLESLGLKKGTPWEQRLAPIPNSINTKSDRLAILEESNHHENREMAISEKNTWKQGDFRALNVS